MAWATDLDPATLRVTVLDPDGAAINSSHVLVKLPGGQTQTRETDQAGQAFFSGLFAGRCEIHVEAPGFADKGLENFSLKAGFNQIEIRLQVIPIQESLDIKRNDREKRTDPRGDGFTTVLTENQIADLPDDPEELEDTLKRIAGPGAIIRVNGFKGGRLPPKSQIQQIRFRRNSYTAEYHELGLTGVDLITKPGTDDWHGAFGFAFRDARLDARNAFAPRQGPGQLDRFNFGLDIPLWVNHTSLSLAAESNYLLDSRTIVAQLPQGSFNDVAARPSHSLYTSARLSHAFSKTNTLSLSFERNARKQDNLGVGDFDLPERAYSLNDSEILLRIADSAAIGRRLFNELRMQVRRFADSLDSASDAPAILVLNAFNSGGAQRQNHSFAHNIEVADNLDISSDRHSQRVGFLVEVSKYRNDSLANQGGTFTFANLLDFDAGRPITFTQRVGRNPVEFLRQQFGVYWQDDIRLSQSFTLSLGLRYERQSRVEDQNNFAPRLGFAWSPWKDGRTTVRGGAGIFYEWVGDEIFGQTLETNGQQQRDVVIRDPGFPDPYARGLSIVLPPSRLQRAADLLNPYIMQASVGVERELWRRTFLRVVSLYQRGMHLLRGRNLNAPQSTLGRPDPTAGNIIQVESTANSWKPMLHCSLNSLASKRFYWLVDYAFSKPINESDGPFSLPANSYDLRSERGPSADEPRHRLFISLGSELYKGLRAATSFYATSGLPYNITTGRDDNSDTIINDRPTGIGRNTAQGATQWNLNLRLNWTKGFGQPRKTGETRGPSTIKVSRADAGNFSPGIETSEKRWTISPSLQVFNLLNHVNLTNYSGIQTSPFFGRATAALPARRVEFGLRFDF